MIDRYFPSVAKHLSGPVARGSILSFAIRVSGIAVGLLQAILTGRILGAEGYGQVAIVLSFAMVFAVVALLGGQNSTVREVARLMATGDDSRLRGYLRVTAVMVLATCAIVAVGVLVWHPFLPTGDAVHFVAWLAPVFALTLLAQAIVRGAGGVAMAQVPFQIVRPVLLTFVLALVWLTGSPFSPYAYLIAVTAIAVIALAIAWAGALHRVSYLKNVAQEPYPLRDWVSGTMPLYVMTVVGLLLSEINTLMLGWWAGPEETGLFQPVAKMAVLMAIGLETMGQRFAPRVTELVAHDRHEQMKEMTYKVTLIATLFSVALAIVVLSLGPWILAVFGREFVAATDALWWIVAAQVFNCACGPVGMLLVMAGHGRKALPAQLAGLAVNVALGALLIPQHGALGAAQAMASGIAVWNMGMLIQVRRHMALNPALPNAIRNLRQTSRSGPIDR